MDRDDFHNDPPPGGGGTPSVFEALNNYVLLLFCFSCFLIYTSMSLIFYDMGLLALSFSLPPLAGIVFPLHVLSGRFGLGFKQEFPFDRPAPLKAAAVILITAGAVQPVDALVWLFERGRPVNEDYINFLVSIKPKGLLDLIALGVGTAVLSPLGEELLFRGVVQRVFHRNMDGRLAILLAGLVFGCAHFDLRSIPAMTLMGVLLGYLLLRTGNLSYPLLAHAAFNLVSLIRLDSASVEELTSGVRATPPPAWLAVSLVALAAGLSWFWRITGERKGDGPGERDPSP